MALIAWQAPNLLLLDEPTNHLDLEMRHALCRALQGFRGALVLVSHDRHLLRATTDEFVLVDGGRAHPFDGDLEDYRRWLNNEMPAQPLSVEAAHKDQSTATRKAQRRDAAALRQRRQPLVKEIAQVEKRMERLNSEKRQLESLLADTGLYTENNKAALKDHLFTQPQLARHPADLEPRSLCLH